MSKQRYAYCPPCGNKIPAPEGADIVHCPQCAMRLRVAGAEIEVSGHSADEVRSVAESMLASLLNRSGETAEATIGSQIDRPITESATAMQRPEVSVFVSHSTQDIAWIEADLIPLLRSIGIVPWYSRDDIRTTEYWERQILTALRKCDWFLIVLSSRSAESEWVKDELHWAIANRANRIIPVLIDRCDLHDFHIRLSRIEYADWVSDRDEAREKIREILAGGLTEKSR